MIHRIEIQAGPKGVIILTNLPLIEGETVEVIVMTSRQMPIAANPYPLRGTPVVLEQPFHPVAECDWGALA